MLKLVFFTSLVFITGSIPSEARPFRNQKIAECNVSMPCDFSYLNAGPRSARRAGWLQMRERGTSTENALNAFASASEPEGSVIGGRPAGCPPSYCGCGAAILAFGRVIPELNVAANWLRLPRTRLHREWSLHATATCLYWNSTLGATCGWRTTPTLAGMQHAFMLAHCADIQS
ncbi:hypothetical protein [Bradyrhizobium sp. CSS354]|uniref:hypothetical protein n=1 Tax=Bradyrhizobium sp. CSS354 TaxID=2699172 RepID=UPI0031833E4B